MIVPRLAPLALLAVGGHAFQVAPPLRAPPSRVLIPRLPSSQTALQTPASRASFRRNKLMLMKSEDDDANIETHAVEVVEADDTSARDMHQDTHALAKFASRLRDLVQSQPGSLLLSLAIFLLPLFTISAFPESAWAVQSGGRMGGSFGGSGRSSSSRSYSAPSGSYSSGYSRGYSSGYYSRPNVIVSPGISPFYSPFWSPFSPFYARPSGVVVSTGPSFGGLFFFAGFFLFAALVLSNIGSSVDSFGSALASDSVLGPGVSVAEISVALDVPNRDSPNSILSALDRLSRTARTDSRVGLQNLTSQVAIEVLRRKSSIVAANTKASHYRDENKAMREYNNISIKERGKFQRETVSKYGGVDYGDVRVQSKQTDYSATATVAVVTIVMLIDGDSTSKQLSGRVNSIRDVEEALSRIAADAKADECLRGAEILWTPEERDDTLTMRDVFADYPGLRSV